MKVHAHDSIFGLWGAVYYPTLRSHHNHHSTFCSPHATSDPTKARIRKWRCYAGKNVSSYQVSSHSDQDNLMALIHLDTMLSETSCWCRPSLWWPLPTIGKVYFFYTMLSWGPSPGRASLYMASLVPWLFWASAGRYEPIRCFNFIIMTRNQDLTCQMQSEGCRVNCVRAQQEVGEEIDSVW